MASQFSLKFPFIWLISFPLPPHGVDRGEGVVLTSRGDDVLLVYDYEKENIRELPLSPTRVVKIKPVDVRKYLDDLKTALIEDYDMNKNVERIVRAYIADVEEKMKKINIDKKEEEHEIDSNDGESSESEDYSDDSVDNEEDNSEESDSESDESDESDDEDSSRSSETSSSSSDDDDEDCIELKVRIESSCMEPEVRGFFLPKRKILKRISKKLKSDYGSEPVLFYIDFDGDKVTLKTYSDVKFAIKSHQRRCSESRDSVLRLHARISDDIHELSQFESTKYEGASNVKQLNSASANKIKIHEDANKLIWQKGELVGSGSFGQVFGGILTKTGKRIAVKEVFLSGAKGQLDQAKAMQVEIRILSTLEHPNIIKYLGAEFTATTLRVFLDLASEGSLKDILNEFGKLSEPLLRKYMRDILCGLDFLHSKRIIHRDIKPSNLLLDKGIVKLADFGCSATVVLNEDNDRSEMQHDTVTGTTIYMSPEVMRGSEGGPGRSGYGRKTDIWSLGVTLCEMSTARAPFKNAAAAIFAVCVSQEYPTLSEEVSKEGSSFLSRCLVDDPDNRADTQELLLHPFCTHDMGEEALGMPASKSHTLSTVSLLPDFNTINKFDTLSAPDAYSGSEDESNSFFENATRKSSRSRRCSDSYDSKCDDDTIVN